MTNCLLPSVQTWPWCPWRCFRVGGRNVFASKRRRRSGKRWRSTSWRSPGWKRSKLSFHHRHLLACNQSPMSAWLIALPLITSDKADKIFPWQFSRPCPASNGRPRPSRSSPWRPSPSRCRRRTICHPKHLSIVSNLGQHGQAHRQTSTWQLWRASLRWWSPRSGNRQLGQDPQPPRKEGTWRRSVLDMHWA